MASAHELALLDRLTWGADDSSAQVVAAEGEARFLDGQLDPAADDGMPPATAKEIADLTLQLGRPEDIAAMMHRERLAVRESQGNPDAHIAAKATLRATLQNAAAAARARSLLRDIYSQDQLKEQMIWFWLNHFNVAASKGDVGAWVGDYEENAIRPHALGRFRDLLEATVHHPAMLIYLDNVQNARGHLNENYAREIMELHTLGIGGGYSQADVVALARILSGLRVNETGTAPTLPPRLAGQYRREGAFEFDPRRHDYGDKMFLGHSIRGSGLDEVEQAIDLLSRSPATARHISRQLAVFFVSDEPPDRLVERMAAAFRRSDGDIPAVLRVLFASPEFAASLGKKYKDPMHFVLSAVRAAYGGQVIAGVGPVENWLNLLGEPLYGCQTPNGYPMTAGAWSGSGAMQSRFRIALALGGGRAKLFGPPSQAGIAAAAPPRIENTSYYEAVAPSLGAATRGALAKAGSPARFDTLFLSSPEFMYR